MITVGFSPANAYDRHGRPCAGHPRRDIAKRYKTGDDVYAIFSMFPSRQGVDARDKRGHDGQGSGSLVVASTSCEHAEIPLLRQVFAVLEMGRGMISNLTRRACCILLGKTLIAPVLAQEAASTGTYPLLARGLNFHHLLNWPQVKRDGDKTDYVWPPFGAASYRLRDDELARLTRLGFDFIRLTVDPSIFLASDQDRRAQLFVLARERLNRIMAAGLKVIFDLHPVAVNPDYNKLKVVESQSAPAFRAYVDLVEQAAREFHDLPYDKFAFELMNEPELRDAAGLARWPAMLEELHDRARSAAPNMPLILSGVIGNSRGLLRLDPTRYRRSNVIYTFHYYEPFVFTHQGYEKIETRYVAGLAWPLSEDNLDEVRRDALSRASRDPETSKEAKEKLIAMTERLLSGYAAHPHDPAHVRKDFQLVADWADRNGIAHDRILLGEFGLLSASHDLVTPGRLEWLLAVRAAAEDFGFPWAFWAYKGYTMPGHGSFALADASGTRLDKGALTALGMSTNGFATPASE